MKTPEEFVISAVRASQGEVVRPAQLLNAMNELGMSFFGCQTPNGYSWKADGWVNTGDLLDRMNLALALASNRQGTELDLDALLKADNPGAQLVDQKETELEQAFLEEPLSDQTRSAVLNQVAAGVGPAGPARAQPLGAGMNPAKGQGKGAALEAQGRHGADDRSAGGNSTAPGQPSGSSGRTAARLTRFSEKVRPRFLP